jgi:hypothetical protein
LYHVVDGECGFAGTRISRFADKHRPEAVNISNVANLVDGEGKPHFKYVIEGANLFFTQQARFWLEKKGVVLFKDSSTNKVGLGFTNTFFFVENLSHGLLLLSLHVLTPLSVKS